MWSRRSSVMWRTSDARIFDPPAEHVGERIDDLTERGVLARGFEERRHQVDAVVGCVLPNARERGLHRRVVTVAPDLLEAPPLLLFDLRTDAKGRRRRLVVPFEEPV